MGTVRRYRCRVSVPEPSPTTAATAPPARWQLRLMAAILIGLAAGYGVGNLLGHGEAAAESAIVAALTLAAGSSGRLRTALPVAALLGTVVVVYSTLGAVTTGYPVTAALAMAFVAFTTSVFTAARPVGLLIGLVASYAYFLVTGIGVIQERAIGGSLSEVGVLGLIGMVTALVLVSIRALVEQAIGNAPAAGRAAPSLIDPIRNSLRTFDDHAKNGVRRAIALGLTMYGFQVLASHNAFWVMLTVFVILAPNGRPSLRVAFIRVLGTLVGVVTVVALSQVLPENAALPLGVLALAVSLAASSRSTAVSAAFGAAAAAVLTALPSGDFAGYAGARLLDTIVGAVIAIATGWLLWPGTGANAAAVPADLTGRSSTTGVAPAGT